MSTSIKSSSVDCGRLSDGYHTFDELYQHRIALWIALCKQIHNDPRHQYTTHDVWRSRLHSDGSDYPGWFMLGIGKDAGDQMTYHMPDSYWDRCGFAQTLDKSPTWDGHSHWDVIERLGRL